MSKPMTTFTGPATKDQVLAGLARHRELDELVQGVYWKDGKGCAVGCVNHDLDPTIDPSDHSAWERLLGIPEEIARLVDAIFEWLPPEEAVAWPERFISSVPVGADLSLAARRFKVRLLTTLAERQEAAIGDRWGVVAAIRGVVAWLEAGEPESEQDEVTRAAESAAESAESAARSESARSESAWSAWAAAESAESAAAWSARSAAWQEMADWLCEAVAG